MRLWTLHPKYLDAKGLVALWREALLAQKVLQGQTKGYQYHPQLLRFREQNQPLKFISSYLSEIYKEAVRRGYQFDATKIRLGRTKMKILETKGQLLYEWIHLKRKLQRRDLEKLKIISNEKRPLPHPLFKIIPGKIRKWEQIT